MTLKSSGRTPININVHRDQIIKSDNIYFEWKKRWNWLTPEYEKLQAELAQTNNNLLKSRKSKHQRTIFPVPETVNHEYGWISTKEEFRLNKWGPDLFTFPAKLPDEDDE